MPPPALLDLASLNLDALAMDRAQIQEIIPHRYEFLLLDAVVLLDLDRHLYAGYYDVREDAWWARGHIPGRPLFPGVLMIEVAAQLASVAAAKEMGNTGFLGFAGLDDAKFRGAVTPPTRFLVIGHGRKIKKRRIVFESQGFVDNTMVFEAEITGMYL